MHKIKKQYKAITKYFNIKTTIKYLFFKFFIEDTRKNEISFFASSAEKKYGYIGENNHKNSFNPSQEEGKNIYVFYYEGIDKASDTVKLCLKSIGRFNSSYQIKVIDKNNITSYLEDDDLVYRYFKDGDIPLKAFSDYFKFTILEKYGGYFIEPDLLFLNNFNLSSLFPKDGDFACLYSEPASIQIKKGNKFPYLPYIIGAKKGSLLVKTIRKTLYDYYKNYHYLYSTYIADLIIYTFYNHQVDGDVLKKIKPYKDDIFYAKKHNYIISEEDQLYYYRKIPQKLDKSISLDDKTQKMISSALER